MGPSTVESVLKLTETLDDEDTLVRNAAAKALADMDIPKPALSEPNNGRRAAAKGDRESL
jgi:HEAT repeat protein